MFNTILYIEEKSKPTKSRISNLKNSYFNSRLYLINNSNSPKVQNLGYSDVRKYLKLVNEHY